MGVTTKTLLLAGATGLVGSEVLKRCLDDAAIKKIIVPTRRPLEIKHRKIENIVMDLADTEKHAELSAAINQVTKSIDTYICCLGTTIKTAGSREAFIAVDRDLVCRLAELCKTLGAKNAIFISSVGATRQSSNFYLRVKGETEDELEKMHFQRLDILRPGLLLGSRSDERLAEAIAQKLSFLYNPLMRGPLRPYRAISAEDVAASALRLCLQQDAGVFIHENSEMMRR